MGKPLQNVAFNSQNIMKKDQVPQNAKIEETKIMDYRGPIPDEKILKSSASTGGYLVCDSNIFFKYDTKPPPQYQTIVPNYKDPWIQMKCIPDGKIVNHNTVITREGHTLMGLQYHYITPTVTPEKMSSLNVDYYFSTNSTPSFYIPVARETESHDRAFFLGGTDNFGHWIFEFLPKLLWCKKYLLDANIDVPIIVGDDVPNRWLEAIEPLGISKDQLILVKRGKTINVKNLYICGPSVSKDFNKDFNLIRLDDINELRVLFRNYFKLYLLPQNIDILIESRERARWRKIVNEDHLLNRLRVELNLKTEKFFPETLSFREQLEKIQRSRCFIGTGASLPISFFMSKDSTLCEVRHPVGAGLATSLITKMARIAYCRPITKVSDNNLGPTEIDVDLEIDETDFMFKMSHLAKHSFTQI